MGASMTKSWLLKHIWQMRKSTGFKKVQNLQLHSLGALRISSGCEAAAAGPLPLAIDVDTPPPPLVNLKLDFLPMSFVSCWWRPFSRTPFGGVALCFSIDFGIPFTSTLTVFLFALAPLMLESTVTFRPTPAVPLACFVVAVTLAPTAAALSFASKFRLRRFSFATGAAFKSSPCTVKSSTSQSLTLL